MAVGGGAGHLFHGHDAAIELSASDVFKLDGGVADREMVAQHVIELDQDAGALRRRNVGNGDVAGERMAVRAEAPYVQIVDVDDAFDGFHAGADFTERNAARRAFEQDVEGFANDADAGPEDQRGNQQREDWVDPVSAR